VVVKSFIIALIRLQYVFELIAFCVVIGCNNMEDRRAMTKHMRGTREEWLAARLKLLEAVGLIFRGWGWVMIALAVRPRDTRPSGVSTQLA
jgi:hypothetical protein